MRHVSRQKAIMRGDRDHRLMCQIFREVAADVVVVGTHGRTGLGHILLGSTTE
jgi:nucleotide-binding universal stress UspA family protein